MNRFYKALCFTSLNFLLFSCGSQKEIKSTSSQIKKTSIPQKVEVPPKLTVTRENGLDFFTQNISDTAKNDNSISYGSIVSAKPAGYKVVKTFFPAVAQNFRQKYLILHYTALDDNKSVSVLTQQAVSVHYIVNNLGDNEIYQVVDENKRAYHAGVSHWRNDNMLNDTSIGIEIVNPGYTTDASGKKNFVAYPDEQFEKVAALAKDIATRYMIPPTNILGHSDIAPTRKQDPGPTFPWKKLYDDYQLGMWYDEAVKQNFLNQAILLDFAAESSMSTFIFKAQTYLKQFGYDIDPSGSWDKGNSKVVEAFQYHFRPSKCDGILDAETWAILQALLQKYPAK